MHRSFASPRTCSVVLLGLALTLAVVHFQVSARAAQGGGASPDAIVAGELLIEPPTLINLGFEWFVQADANRNAVVTVSFRTCSPAASSTSIPAPSTKRSS
jgi:hypothetical protein